MRALVQLVKYAEVTVAGKTVGRIDSGLLILTGFEEADIQSDLEWMAKKLVQLRIFPDEYGVMNRSVIDVGGNILAVPQFTLFASYRKGSRPSWNRAVREEVSNPLFKHFVELLSLSLGHPVPSGVFGADMQVSLLNDGPVTLMLDSKRLE